MWQLSTKKLSGFKRYYEDFTDTAMRKLGVDPSAWLNQVIVASNVRIGEDYFSQPTRFRVINVTGDSDKKTVTIKCVSDPDEVNNMLPKMPHEMPSPYSGKTYRLSQNEFNNLITPQIPPGATGDMGSGGFGL
jgi:hypothetical protein